MDAFKKINGILRTISTYGYDSALGNILKLVLTFSDVTLE